VTLIGLITIGISTYMINYSHRLFEIFKPRLGIFERRQLISEADPIIEESDFIIFGYGRFGRHLVERLACAGHTVMVVDWNPYARIHLDDESVSNRVRLVFGDADDPEFPGTLPLNGAKWIVSTINSVDTNRVVAESLRRWGTTAKIAVTALSVSDRIRLQAGVERGVIDLILQPFDDAADDAIAAMAHEE
jgi:Trk K+ transport system NAD-binding subunit